MTAAQVVPLATQQYTGTGMSQAVFLVARVGVFFVCAPQVSDIFTISKRFLDRGRVCGDRSVFVTSHRPAHSSCAHAFSLDRILHFTFEVFFYLPTAMSLDLELAKILDEFAVPEAFRTKLVDSVCLKVWQFAEYVDDVKVWTGILSSLEPPIVDRMHIASVRRAYKAACARDAELLSRGRDYPGEDMDAPIESNRRRTLIEAHARHYRFHLQLSRQPSDTLLGRLDREKDRGAFTVINLAEIASVAAQSVHTKHIEVAPGIFFNLGTHET